MATINTPPITYTYRVFHLPTADPARLAFFAGKFASLHLSALQTSASAFSSQFGYEAAWNASEWIARLQRPLFHNFIAVAYPSDYPSHQQTLETGDWIGCGTAIGPTPLSSYDIPLGGGPPMDTAEAEKWHMTFVYNEPSHRRKGVTQLLIQAVLDFSEANAREQGKKSWMRIIIHPDNLVVKGLYTRFGFVEAGSCSLVDALLANGDSDLVPEDDGRSDMEKYRRKSALIMMKSSDA